MSDKLILENYIERVVLPYYSTFVHSASEIGIRQIGGSTLFVNEPYAAALKGNLRANDIIGLPTSSDSDICNSEISRFCRQLDRRMLERPSAQEFIVRDVRQDGKLNFGLNTPLFAPDGSCFGFQFTYQAIAHSRVASELLERQAALFNTKTIALENFCDLALDAEELKVLSLLMLGYSQAQIATALGRSRTYVATKVIGEKLCPKFGVSGFSSRVLVDKAIALGYANFIPKNLLLR